MKKEDINYEFISKIEIQIEDTLFYIPEETIKGSILINPKYQIKIKDGMLHLSLKIMQYEFWEYSKNQLKEIKNIYTTKIQEENIEYKLKSDETTKSIIFDNFSLIEKDNKMISIPFEIKIKKEKILPTFQFQNKDYILGIRHLLVVDCKEYNSSNYIGLFIGKIMSKDLDAKKEIKEKYKVGLDTLELIANFEKLSFNFDEGINFDIKTNTNLHFQKITKLEQNFYRKIEWIGYMKNSILSKDNIDTQQLQYNPNEHCFFSRLTMPLSPIINAIGMGAAGGLVGVLTGAGIGSGSLNDDLDNKTNGNSLIISNIIHESININNISEPSKIDNSNVDNDNDNPELNKNNEVNNTNDESELNKINEPNDNNYSIRDIINESNSNNNSDSNKNDVSDNIIDNSETNKINELINTNNNNSDSDIINEVNKPEKENKANIIGGIIGGIFGGVIGISLGTLGGILFGVSEQYDIMKDILNINYNQNEIINNFSPKLIRPEYEKILIDNLKKFVYFKDNKVVGFIKFAYNILPPVKGYYFKCNYNIKINVEVAGIILSSNKYLKTQVDLYDSEEYISKMKKIFKSEK